MTSITRNEYPRPQFERSEWMNLNGTWEFEFDDHNIGEMVKWYKSHPFSKEIKVPFCFQSELSGIGDTSFHDIVWYRRNLVLPDPYMGKRIVLHFGAVDYSAKVWINGEFSVAHEGGHTPFSADITDLLQKGNNTIVVRAQDYSQDVTLPRGKQYWKEKSDIIFYTRTTGIWQSVWLEPLSTTYLQRVQLTPDIDHNKIQIRSFVNGWAGNTDLRLKISISFQGKCVVEDLIQIKEKEEERTIKLHDFNDHGMGQWWSPEQPNLYDVQFTLIEKEQIVDQVNSYFGMRKISIEDGIICLNNRPYYMKLILDQGYFPGGVLTAASDETFRKDIEYTKLMGFNGVRKHQKIEDPRYIYWCDRMGLLLWGEMANAYQYSEKYVSRFTQEWQEAIQRDYNHPCLVVWVPINESWGVPNILVDKRQQEHVLSIYHLTKSLDSTRLVISNDGWEHVKSDICTIHDYEWRREVLEERYASQQKAVTSNPQKRWLIVPGCIYNGEPLLISEFGGISFIQDNNGDGWGYSAAQNKHDFMEKLIAVIQPMLYSKDIQGYCYTQLTDVEQEKNGLLTFDRLPKIPIEIIRQINEGKSPDFVKEQEYITIK
ncbi:MAG TPA: glycoside hydrolase family 2 TIM barrel-domain containing protein [Bacilli bacterium]